ncbi:MAG: MCE family protein [Bacteroidetes bacterium]|nr:MCE family protein [Bacteroidota bacterium]MBU1678535.1 MCE family protein [Bacteroidota bacterium]MBU2508248.1 MCE family protein [Bacteroidota bacterium]
MVTKSQKVRLGIFVFISLTIFGLIIAALSMDKLFKEKDVYYIAYENVSVGGLDIGSSVKYLGIKIGTVSDIKIDSNNINIIVVTVDLEKGTPIKSDIKAEIATIGITGLKLIELAGGTSGSNFLKPGDFIQSGRSFTEDITGRAEVIAEKVEQVVNNLLEFTSSTNQNKLFSSIDDMTVTFGDITTTLDKINNLLDQNSVSLTQVVANADSISNEFLAVSRSARATVRAVENVVKSDTLIAAIGNISRLSRKIEKADINRLVEEAAYTINKLNQILDEAGGLVYANRVKIDETVQELNEMIKYLRNTAKTLDEDPSVIIGGLKLIKPPDDKIED